MQPTYKPSIFIATPNLGEIATGNTLNLISWFMSGKYRLQLYPPEGKQPLDRARNLCHKAFLESKADYLFFLDEHTIPPVNVIDRLLADNKDMVSATVQILKTDNDKLVLIPMALRWDKEANGYKPYWGTGLEQVDATTCACTLIKRKVMEEVGHPAFRFPTTDEWGIEGLSEDLHFSEAVRKAGYKIHNDYRILCSHKSQADTKAVNDMLVAVNDGR